jgi:hypothetical protein
VLVYLDDEKMTVEEFLKDTPVPRVHWRAG